MNKDFIIEDDVLIDYVENDEMVVIPVGDTEIDNWTSCECTCLGEVVILENAKEKEIINLDFCSKNLREAIILSDSVEEEGNE